jgi:signal transduction histidine kinase
MNTPAAEGSGVDLLKAKAMLLLRRERELFDMRVAADRVETWLSVFHSLSEMLDAGDRDAILSRCSDLLVEQLGFGVVIVFRMSDDGDKLRPECIRPRSRLVEPVPLGGDLAVTLRANRHGSLDSSGDGVLAQIAHATGLEKLFWFCFPVGKESHYVLVAGFPQNSAPFHTLSASDEGHFVMMGNHLAALLSNSELVEELAAANDELRANGDQLAALVRSKDQFVASVSHELRTPLTVVMGLAEELAARRGLLDDCDVTEYLETIVDQSHDVAHIVEDLLAAARADSGTLTVHCETVDLDAEVAAIMRTGSLHGEAGHRIQVSPGTARAWADPSRVRQIIRNLVVNAVRYGGDHIVVATGSRLDSALVAVTDDGAGLRLEDAARIFEPYYRASRETVQPGSVGLGLAVSRKLANLMAGDVTYQRVGQETVFELSLPNALGEDAP